MEMQSVVVPNALVEVMLVVGMDDNTGLQPRNAMGGDDVLSGLYYQEYEPVVLAALSATNMVYFYPFPHQDPSYPPDDSILSNDTSSGDRAKMSSSQDNIPNRAKFQKSHRPKTNRSVSYNPKTFTRHTSVHRKSVKKKTVTLAVPELPISEEVIRAISSFCFPDDAKVYENRPENSCHFLVLTDVSGNKTYTTCLTFYRTYIAEKDDQDNTYIQLESTLTPNLAVGQKRCYIPYCCVTVSKYPYFTVMKEALSSMVMQIERDPEEMYTFVKDFSFHLMLTPVPPAGRVSVDITVSQLPICVLPPSHADRQVVDIPLHLIFLCFPVSQILRILSCVLVEERLVFLSENYALLTIIMETVGNMIVPFRWRFTYVPILSSKCLEYIQAPGTFMFGCHRKHKQEAEQVPGLVLVDIDEGTVVRNHDDEQDGGGSNHGDPILPIPQEAAKVFSGKCRHFRLQFDCLEAQRPFSYNMEELRKFRHQKIQKCNTAILSTCLELMVNLFRGIGTEIRIQQSRFNKQVFLNKHPEESLAFYDKVFQTDMFKVFLEDRRKEKNDVWSEFEMKTRKELISIGPSKSSGASLSHPRPLRRQSTLSQIISQNAPVALAETESFNLPDILNAKTYVRDTIRQLSQKIKECPDFDDRVSYIYLRCLFYAAAGNKKATMDDLISLASSNARIVPVMLLKETYYSLSEEEKKDINSRQSIGQLLDLLDAVENDEGEGHHDQNKISMDPITIPDRDLDHEEFFNYVYLLEMSSNYDTIQRLFEALTGFQRSTYVEQETFQACVVHWQENLNHISQITIEGGHLEETEDILKLSPMLKTDYGIGRIALTEKRLFFLKDVSNQFQEIAKLKNIISLRKSQQQTFMVTADTILIDRKDGTTFTVQFKEERNWWYMVIYEVWAGKVISMATKDIMAITQAAENALLIDALIGSGQEGTIHSHNAVKAAQNVAHYTQLVTENKHILPHDMREALQHRMDPNCGERERKAVHALLYTEGDAELSPRLWVGLSDGKVKVYNAINWILESECVQTKQCVACLSSVGKGQVWAGSRGIFIIDSETITCNKMLPGHPDLVVDIVLYQGGKFVFTASLDGTIIKWDAEELKQAQDPIKLKDVRELRALKVQNGHLWCGTWNNVLLANLKGEVTHAFQYKEDNKVVQLDSFVVLANEIWAGCRREEKIVIWDIDTKKKKAVVPVKGSGIGTLALTQGRIWVATKSGSIAIFTIKDRKPWKVLESAHKDAVRVLCVVENRYVISGASSKDGKIAVWSATANTTDSGNYLDMTHF